MKIKACRLALTGFFVLTGINVIFASGLLLLLF